MQERELTLKEIVAIVWDKRKMISWIVGAVSVLTAIVSLLLPVWYKSTVVILPPSSQSSFSAASLIGQLGFGGFLGEGEDVNRFMALLKSRTIMEKIAHKYDLQNVYETEDMETTLRALDGNLTYEIGEENQLICSILDQDQDRVADMANFIAQCLDSMNIAFYTGQAGNTRKFIESRVFMTLDSLKMLESELTKLMKNEGIMSLEDQVSVAIAKAADIKAEIMSKEIEFEVAQKTIHANNSQIQKLQLELNTLKRKYRSEFFSSGGDGLIPDLSAVPELGIQFLRLKRQSEYYIKVLEFLGPQYEQSKIEEAKQIPTLQVLDPGVRPEKKDKPRRARMVIIAFVLTLGASIYLAFFLGRMEQLKNTSNEN